MRFFDCHADTLTGISGEGQTLWENKNDIDLSRITNLTDTYGQIFAIWRDAKKMEHGQGEEEFYQMYQNAMTLLNDQQHRISFCKSATDMDKAFQSGKAAAFLAIEDLSIMGSYADRISELGFRFAMLTWNYENQYACGSVANQGKGLTATGKDMLRKLRDQKLMIDISHLSDQGVEDVFSMVDSPLMASHSNVRDICSHPRNLKKEQIQEMIRRKGLIGMNFFRPFLGPGQSVPLGKLFEHMDYILSLGGEDTLAFGTDFDGCTGLFPEGIQGVQSMPYIYEQMEKFGINEVLLNKIFFENSERFIRDNLK